MSELKQLQELVTELNNTNSSNEKKVILAKHPQCKEMLKYVYNPFWRFGVTSKNCIKRNDIENDVSHYEHIFQLLDALKERDITGHDAIGAINCFSCDNPDYKDLIWLILDRNLKTRTDAKLINKVWKGLIPSFEVALAKKLDEKLQEKLTFDRKYFISRKLDGLRCITIITNDTIKFYSRAGNEFLTLGKVKEAFESIENLPTDIVFDGEICITDEKGNEDFTSAISQVKKKDSTVERPRYKIFDMLTLEEFSNKVGDTLLSERYKNLNDMIPISIPELDIVEQVPMTEESFAMMNEQVTECDWEGLILRKNVFYEGKRSNNMLKVKNFFDDEYVVEDVEMGVKPMMNDEGLMEEVDCLAAVKIRHKGKIVGCGSGFSDSQRLEFFTNPEKIIGKTINVQYFEESVDKNGDLSLRFPTIKFIYENGRDV